MGLANCGGLKFNEENFKLINNVLTLKDKETVTNKFVAPMCGGILLDGDVFESFYINGKNIIGEKGVTPTEYIVSNCSLLFDEGKFEINQYGEISSKPIGEVAGLKFTAVSAGSTIKMVDMMESDTPSFNMEYSIDDGDTWNEYSLGTTITLANVNDSVFFRGDNPNGLNIDDYEAQGFAQLINFVGTGKIACSKNIMYLIDKNGERNEVPSSCFCGLFADNEQEGWLTQAPELPATTLARGCYFHMFDGCISLTQAPELPATTLASMCYEGMFNGCTSLTNIKIGYSGELPANGATFEWMTGVSQTGDAYFNGTVTDGGTKSSIPSGWTIHTF